MAMVFRIGKIALPSLPQNPLKIRILGLLEAATGVAEMQHNVGQPMGHRTATVSPDSKEGLTTRTQFVAGWGARIRT